MQQPAEIAAVAAYSVWDGNSDRPLRAMQALRHYGRVTMQNKTLWIGIAAAVLLCGCALQDDVYTLDHRLSALERRNAELENQNRELDKLNRDLVEAKESISSRVEGLDQTRRDDEMALRGQYAGLAAQLETVQQNNQQLSGRLEEMEYLLSQKLSGLEENQLKNRERMDRLTTDVAGMQKRLDAVDQYLNLEGGQASKKNTAAIAVAAPAAKPTSDQNLYLESKRAFDEGRLDAARKGFQQLIESYPTSTHADNSQFWIGETFYRQKWYEKAILEYQKVIENYPSGNKVPAALLKQGLAFVNIGETNNARLVLKELIAKHPGTNEASIAQKKLDSL
jgi:tol-pal system protein YbgF